MKTFTLAIAALLTTIALFAQEDEYKPAHYYDTKGNRVDGFVNTTRGVYHNFQFKKTLQDEPEKIMTLRLTAMVIEQDSFAVIRNFNVESASSNADINIPVALGKVLETGQVNLYEANYIADAVHTTQYNASSMASIGPMKGKTRSTYIVQTQGTKRFYSVEVGIDDFIKQMSSFLKMSAPIVEKLKSRAYSNSKSQQLVRDFNAWYINR
jgi:hypothetical protein